MKILRKAWSRLRLWYFVNYHPTKLNNYSETMGLIKAIDPKLFEELNPNTACLKKEVIGYKNILRLNSVLKSVLYQLDKNIDLDKTLFETDLDLVSINDFFLRIDFVRIPPVDAVSNFKEISLLFLQTYFKLLEDPEKSYEIRICSKLYDVVLKTASFLRSFSYE